jgi:hypothetical protein
VVFAIHVVHHEPILAAKHLRRHVRLTLFFSFSFFPLGWLSFSLIVSNLLFSHFDVLVF